MTRLLLAAVLALTACSAPLSTGDSSAPTVTPRVSTVSPTPGAVQYPDDLTTPGLPIATTNAADLCPKVTTKRVYLSKSDKRGVLIAYGLDPDTKPAEWDHLVSLELGGGNGPRNIWPQLDHTQDQRKDRLENQLHRQVCSGAISLDTAQARIREFWRYW